MSLKVALEELGAGPCLHSLESLNVAGAPGGASRYQRLARGERIDWAQELSGWGSSVDWLGARFYPEMLRAWPQAKVVLSIREPQAWYESCYASLHAMRSLSSDAAPGRGAHSGLLEAVDGLIWKDIFDGRFTEREHALEIFAAHRRRVVRLVPAERLLIYDTAEGWGALCEFLGVPVPETPFPHLNGRNAFWARFGIRAATSSTDSAGAPVRELARHREPADCESAGAQPACVRIAGLAVAHPQSTLTQQQVLELLGLTGDEFARRIFSRGGIERRRLHLRPSLLQRNMQGRTAAVEQQLLQYAVEAVDRLEVDHSNVGTVITASLYSLGCPTLGHRLIEHMQMDPATDKYHLTGVGCASAVPLIRLAEQSITSHPGKQALIIAAESMSGILAGGKADDPRSKTIGSAIFGDGCAAMLLDARPDAAGPKVIASKVHQIPGTLHAVSLEFDEQDSYLQLIKELPDVAGAHLRKLVDGFLAANGMTGHMIEHWLVHPGGRRILESAQQALCLTDDQVKISFEVLANHGNVGTPSIFYVTQKTIEQRNPAAGEHGLMVTIGPGVTIGLMMLRW